MQRLSEAPEVTQALAKAEEYGRLAALAKTPREQKDFERLRIKWLGIADGWRVITEFDAAHDQKT
jgi:hypothetical protein